MQRLIIAISCLSLVRCEEDLCAKVKPPNPPVHFDPDHGTQWRVVATEGQKQDGTIIVGAPSEPMYPTVIRGHWAIGELEWYSDDDCESGKHPTLKDDGTVVSPLHTTYGWQDDCPLPNEHWYHDSLVSDPPWYPEMRAIDGCYSSEFWSACYQCEKEAAWYGLQFHKDDPNTTQIRCLKIFQKDADAYTATRVELQRWVPPSSEVPGQWQKHADWTGLNGGRWYVLKANSTVAIAGTQRNAVPGLLGLIAALLWAAC